MAPSLSSPACRISASNALEGNFLFENILFVLICRTNDYAYEKVVHDRNVVWSEFDRLALRTLKTINPNDSMLTYTELNLHMLASSNSFTSTMMMKQLRSGIEDRFDSPYTKESKTTKRFDPNFGKRR